MLRQHVYVLLHANVPPWPAAKVFVRVCMFASKDTFDGCKQFLDTQRRASEDYVASGNFWIAVGYCKAILDGEST